MKTFIATTEEKLSPQIATFCRIYPTYADKLKVDADKITNLNAGSIFLIFILSIQAKLQNVATTFTAYKNLLLSGQGGGVLGALPVLTVYPALPPAVSLADLEGLFRIVIQQCVKSGNLSEDIAKALGIFYDAALQNLEEGTPDLSLKSMSAGHPTLHATLKDYEGFEIWKDAGTGFTFLNVSTSANFTDTAALPALGVEAIWKYKLIYRYKNAQIGNWSATISVAVKGSV